MKLGDAKPPSRTDGVRLEELVDLVKLPNNKWVQIRILPTDIISYRQHWINIIASKTKREVRIPKLCLAHDPQTEEMRGPCPYCSVDSQTTTNYLVNVIVRSIQEDAPAKIRMSKEERESGFKDPDSDSWTPVRVLRVPAGLMRKIQELKALNKHKTKDGVKTFDVNHERYGVDLNIKYDENAKGPDKYQVNLAEKTPLTEEEMGYLQYELNEDLIKRMGLEDLATAKKEVSRMQIVGAEEFNDDDEDDDDLGVKKSSGKAASKGKKRDDEHSRKKASSKKGRDLDEDDEDLDDDFEVDDEEPPSRKKPSVKKGKDLDEDDEDLDDDFGDDEDDEPAPRKKPGAKKGRDLDEDDEDLDEDFEDDEDDEPPSRKKSGAKKPSPKKPAAKKARRDEDDEDLDEDDEDLDDDFEDDEDDEPHSRKKVSPKKGKDLDEDDEDLDDDFEDDEDDEPPYRKKPSAKKPSSKKPAAKKARRDEDEDEPF